MVDLAGTGRVKTVSGFLQLVMLTALLVGCAQSHPIPRAPDGDPIDAARALSDAPDVVREGGGEESCGGFVLGQGENVPAAAVECLNAALSAGDPAELAWSHPTVEGDPIVRFAFVGDGSDEVTVYSTNAFDSYGGEPKWTKTSCGDAATATSLAGCSAP